MKRPKIGYFPAGLLLLLLAYGLFVQVFFLFHFIHGPSKALSRLIVVPAAIVPASDSGSRMSLSYYETLQLARASEAFGGVEKKGAFDDGLRIGVHRQYVDQLAAELNVEVTDSEVVAYGVDEAAIAEGLDKAKWTMEDYRRYVVEPLLLAQKVEQAAYGNDASQEPAREELNGLLAKVDEGIPFTDVARYFSQDLVSAKAGGAFDLLPVNGLPAWLAPAVNLEVGERSGILSATDAYWVVELVDKQAIDDEEFVYFRGIAVKKKALGEIIAARRAEHPPVVLVW